MLVIRVVVAVVLFLTASSLQAQTKDRLDRREKLFGFEAVGLLEGPSGTCTAALIARDVVVTAAHCVHGQRGGYTFRAAFSDGTAIASRNVEDVVIAQGYIDAAAVRDRVGEVENDVALARLASPIHEVGVDPYQIARAPRVGTQLTLASYGQGRMGALQLERGCRLNTRYRGGVARIDCDATFGSSGAPVFFQVNGRPRIFSIVSGGGNLRGHGGQTLGVELSAHIPALLQKLRNNASRAPATEGARRTIVGERTPGGARFIRPVGN